MAIEKIELNQIDAKKVDEEICPDCGGALYGKSYDATETSFICGTCGHTFAKTKFIENFYRTVPKKRI